MTTPDPGAQPAPITQTSDTVRLPYSVFAISSFALGLAGLLLFAVPALPWLLSILAVVLGHTGRREIKQGVKQGWGYDLAGLTLGYVVLAVLVVGVFTNGG